MIVPVKNGFKIRSHKTGKLFPKVYPTREAAKQRIKQMLMFKKMRG
ncbi:MAG: hypothetical protein AB1668_07545 [Nanoarchaeota archaeon]